MTVSRHYSLVPRVKFTYWVGLATNPIGTIFLLLAKIWFDIPTLLWLFLCCYMIFCIYVCLFNAVTDVIVSESELTFISLFKRISVPINSITSIENRYQFLYLMQPYLFFPVMIYHTQGRVLLIYPFDGLRNTLRELQHMNPDITYHITLPTYPYGE